MRSIRLEKLTLNMGAGDSAQKLEASKKVLLMLTGKTPVVTKTKKRSTFGVPKKKEIGVKITLRKGKGEELLKKLMKALEDKIKPSYFDTSGNFSFGISEYIHIPGAGYDPDIGMLGLDVAVTLGRPGFRVKKRKTRKSKVGKGHVITREEAMEWAKGFGFHLREKEEDELI